MKKQEFESLALTEALETVHVALDEGDLALAETLFGRLPASHPENAAALHDCGLLAHRLGRQQQAIELVRRSAELDPNRSDWLNALGNLLAEDQRPDEARQAFMAALELDPNCSVVWNNLGAIQERQVRLDDAESSYRQAIELAPDFIDALSNLGQLLASRGKVAESVEYLCRAFVASATDSTPKDLLGIACSRLGRLDDAREVYREWLRQEPGHPIATHLYAACSGVDVPVRASNSYIEAYFDELAKSFDEKLTENLGYQVPRLIARTLAQQPRPERKLIGLDAGCGTGLCGLEILPYVEHLTGIDLSSNMLDLARQKGIYDALVKIELTEFLRLHPDGFDLIVIADTLIYFGPLHAVFEAVRTALRPEGQLIFTAEAPLVADQAYCIKPNGRYGHGREYLCGTLQTLGFGDVTVTSAPIRIELGWPVDGFVVTARNGAIM